MKEKKNYDKQLIKKQLLDSLNNKNYNFPANHLSILHEKFSDGTIQWDRNISNSILQALEKIDKLISVQLNEVFHHPEFLKIEGSWRGIRYIIKNNQNSSNLKIKIMDLKKYEIKNDFYRNSELDQSYLFKKIYETEFGTPGGEPFNIIVGDYSFSHEENDMEILNGLAKIGASAFCPFLCSAAPELFGFENWQNLQKPRDLKSIFATDEYIKWRALRQREESRFIILTLPKVLARLPYYPTIISSEYFNYNEFTLLEENTSSSTSYQLTNNYFCWMNAAFSLADKIIQAFNEYGWSTAIRGAESGGKVTHLPLLGKTYKEQLQICPTEITITDKREAELSDLGFLPLCYYKRTDYAVFFGAQSIHLPPQYDTAEACANAAIGARLPYLLASSRFAHYIKVMARDKIGTFMNPEDLEAWLNRWILNYVNGNPQSGQEMKAKYPLAEAKIKVEESPENSGKFHVIAWLKPWLQLEELSTSLRMVAKIPYANNY